MAGYVLREGWATKVGMTLSLIGVAVGLGNVWRFPYMLGKFGGAAFLIVYLAIVVFVGLPGLWVELLLSRHVQSGPFKAFEKLGLPGGKYVGVMLVIVALAAVSYYLVVIGWVMWYLIASITGALLEMDSTTVFNGLVGDLRLQLIMDAAVIAICVGICAGGIRGGIERVSKFLMPLVYLILVILAVRSLTLPNAVEGLRYYLMPDWGKLNEMTVLAAMGQVFFSLGLGSTWIFIYGSYMASRSGSVAAGSWTAFGDTAASFLAGLVVLPTAFSFGVDPVSGPPLIFITLPEIFKVLPYGVLLSSMFFICLLIAAILSAVPGFEIFVDALRELGVPRLKALALMAVIELLLGIPSMISIDVLLYNDLFWGTTMLPVASLMSLMTFGWILRKDEALSMMAGDSVMFSKHPTLLMMLYHLIKYVLPIFIVLIILQGWYSWFS